MLLILVLIFLIVFFVYLTLKNLYIQNIVHFCKTQNKILNKTVKQTTVFSLRISQR